MIHLLKLEQMNNKPLKIGMFINQNYLEILLISFVQNIQEQLFYLQLATMTSFITINLLVESAKGKAFMVIFLIYGFQNGIFQKV